MSKRRAEDELTKDNQHLEEEEDDPRYLPVDPVKRATKDVLAGRTIAKPRSLLRGSNAGGNSAPAPAANPFSASLGIKPVAQPAQSAAAPQNPFSFLGSKPSPSAPSFTANAATSMVSLSANPPVGAPAQSNKLKIAALNAKFAETIASYAKGSTGDWTKACQAYIDYRQQINDSANTSLNEPSNATADVSMENETPVEQEKPTASSSITSNGFKFASSSNDTGFSFGGKTLKNEAVGNKPSGVQGFVFKSDAKKASELPFKVDDKPKEEPKKEPEQPKEKPAFSFGTPTTEKPAFSFGKKDAPESKFSFGQANNDSPKFSFGKAAEEKPKFSFGQTSEEKPSFNFGDKTDKPKFSFGANSDGQKFQFSSGAASSEDKPASTFGNSTTEKPKFTFGGAADGDKPKFTFGASTAWTPGDKIKFDQPPSNGESKSEDTSNNNEGADEDAGEEAEAGEAIDLSGKGPGEENEDSVYEKKAKVYELVDGQFKPVGLGNLRVLVDKETNKSRVLIRADGSGRVLVNIGLRKQLNYTHEGNGQVKILDFSAADKPPVTYLVRVKTAADGEELKAKLEEVKN